MHSVPYTRLNRCYTIVHCRILFIIQFLKFINNSACQIFTCFPQTSKPINKVLFNFIFMLVVFGSIARNMSGVVKHYCIIVTHRFNYCILYSLGKVIHSYTRAFSVPPTLPSKLRCVSRTKQSGSKIAAP